MLALQNKADVCDNKPRPRLKLMTTNHALGPIEVTENGSITKEPMPNPA